MVQKSLQIRMAGESGEGVLSTGELVTRAAARAGYRVLTSKTNPAEIKGGHATFQVCLGPVPMMEAKDELDVLVAFNEEAWQKSGPDLRPGGLLIYDSASFQPPQDPDRSQYAVPMTGIARDRLKFGLAKNVVAVGVVAALFDLDREVLCELIEQKFSHKGAEVVARNLEALDAGRDYVREVLPQEALFAVEADRRSPTRMLINGNQALSLGFLAAGCSFFAGYPITPASDVMEFLAVQLPRVGGVLIQAEDEIASLGMVLGASYTGARAMTATSGPGLSLMVEMLGLASMAEIPCVILDVQRAGPSTGLPTRHEQSDLFLAAVGGHGDSQRLVLAPTSVADCFDQAVNAFNLAERYQVPVLVLSDTVLASRMTDFERPDLAKIPRWERLTARPTDPDFERYQITESGVSPMSLPGTPFGQYVATGLEHNPRGLPRYDAANHAAMSDKRFRKFSKAALDAPEPFRQGDPDSELGLLTWGSTTGAVASALQELELRGVRMEMLAPRMLWPLPDHQIGEFLERKKRVAVVECNRTGQMATLVASRYNHPHGLGRINVYGGAPFRQAELIQKIEEWCQHVR